MIAPTILPQEDVAARSFCRTLLKHLDIRLVLGQRATHLTPTTTPTTTRTGDQPKAAVVLENGSEVFVDLVICATGRALAIGPSGRGMDPPRWNPGQFPIAIHLVQTCL